MGLSGNSGGKGSAKRHSQVPDEVVADNWDKIFGKKEIEPTVEDAYKVLYPENPANGTICEYPPSSGEYWVYLNGEWGQLYKLNLPVSPKEGCIFKPDRFSAVSFIFEHGVWKEIRSHQLSFMPVAVSVGDRFTKVTESGATTYELGNSGQWVIVAGHQIK